MEVGDGSFLGIGAKVLPGIRLGRHCVIGAGAVVTRDIPDYSVAMGIPAAVKRQSGRDMQAALEPAPPASEK
ncbi:putative acetyltransferase [compost metagenome]